MSNKLLKSFIALSVMLFVFSPAAVFAESRDNIENIPIVDIYYTSFDDLYEIDYYDIEIDNTVRTYESVSPSGMFLLLYNGGFVNSPSILLQNGSAFMSADRLAGLIGAELVKNSEDCSLTFTKANSSITLYTASSEAVINGVNRNTKLYPSPLYIGEYEDWYVPIRIVAETLGGSVEYIEDYVETVCDGGFMVHPKVNIIVVEMPTEYDHIYSIDNGLEKIASLSIKEHETICSYLRDTGRDFEETAGDYDPMNIKYTCSIGRYYVYVLEKFKNFPILFNKYTGDIYSNMPGRAFVYISEGFPNISWVYQ